jgi:hypothetical protein
MEKLNGELPTHAKRQIERLRRLEDSYEDRSSMKLSSDKDTRQFDLIIIIGAITFIMLLISNIF